ncbi:MAG TPA: hypothetical protein VK461_09050 [Acidimicrobiales bacterium]|nr:hypothetical protein [Acidimicrobiales bacterium]
MRSLASARDALDLILLSASDPPEHQTIVLLGKPGEGGGVSVIIEGDVPPSELVGTLGLLAGAAGAGSPIVVATLTPEPPTFTDLDLAAWHDLDAAVSEHDALLCEWFLVGGGTAIAVGEWCELEPRWPVTGSRASASRRRRASPRAFRPRR